MGRAGFAIAAVAIGLLMGALALAPSASGFGMTRKADGTPDVISPATTAQPVEVVEWVDPRVSATDEAWITDTIRRGLDLWENVPTSGIRFTTTIVHGPTQPPKECGQLSIAIYNLADLRSGSATFPGSGCAGGWLGAAANIAPGPIRDRFYITAAHEIGHALGFMHSTVSFSRFSANIPVMHWSMTSSDGLTEDDTAAVSVAYPDPVNPLASTTGSIRGRTIDQASLPLDGVNLVAVNDATGRPAVARVSGSDGQSPGAFDVVGLPPGTYSLHVLDGRSTGGDFLGIDPQRFQADNFEQPPLGPFVVSAGSVRDLGNVALQIKQMSVHGSGASVSGVSYDYEPAYDPLPDAVAGQPYSASYLIDGGVRPLTLVDTDGLPAGLRAELQPSDVGADHAAPSGVVRVRISGTTEQSGPVRPVFRLRDARGSEASLPVPWLTPRATVSSRFGMLTFEAQPGQSNELAISFDSGSGNYVVTDAGAGLKASGSCSKTSDVHRVTCRQSDGIYSVSSLDVRLGDEGDRAVIDSSAPVSLSGGDGVDVLRGGPETDWIDGGAGADTMLGGPGSDTVNYDSRSSRVTADLDGVADDGELGERDLIATDVENLQGSAGDDRLTGSVGSNVIAGMGGNDKLYGYRSGSKRSGDAGDLLFGGSGDDILYGQAGDDSLYGDVDDDRLYGKAGADMLFGGQGWNRISGGSEGDTITSEQFGADAIRAGSGDDTIDAADDDALDRLSCNSGFDSFGADPGEKISSCEERLPSEP